MEERQFLEREGALFAKEKASWKVASAAKAKSNEEALHAASAKCKVRDFLLLLSATQA